jgi:DNA-binding SARP family transcriptional activator/tetratricopeptide (TPR) repeat protein
MTTSVPPQSRFTFCCLGPVLLTGPDGAVLVLRTRKQIALLLLLARQRGKSVSRDSIIELLWPEDGAKQARHSLSQSVSLVNKVLGVEAVAASDKDRIVLRANLVGLDVCEFERLAASGDPAEARALWHGRLLEEIWIPRAPGFERWLADERQRLERVLRRLVHRIIEDCRAEGDYQAMQAEAEALLELEALDERAMLACLEALQLQGDRTQALRRYGEFELRLKEELDAEPGSALRGWARRNRRVDSGAESRYVPIPRVSEITVLPSPQPIFGRAEEYGQLWSAWERARTGKGAFIILEGEAGIGKTALATNLVNQVHVAGGSVCYVKCYRTDKSVPFAPVTALIRQLSRLPGFIALDPVWIGELTRLVPELRDRYPNAPLPMAVDDAARHRLSDATVQAALCVADEQALLMVVDDLQDADEATLAVLHYLGRQAAQTGILTVASARRAPMQSVIERVFFDALRAGGFGRTVQLGPLRPEDARRVAVQVLARRALEVPDAVVQSIVADSGGNPLRVSESAASVNRDGTASSTQPGAVTLPDRVFDASVALRLQGLTSGAREVAEAVAVSGRPLSTYELNCLTRMPIAPLASAMFELEKQELMVQVAGGLGFCHEVYADAVSAQMKDEPRIRLHLELAQLLRQSAARNPEARYEVAKHYQACGRHKDARHQALAAAKYARSLGAVRELASALHLALDVTQKMDLELAVELGECLLELREFDQIDGLSSRITQWGGNPEDYSDFRYLRLATAIGTGRIDLAQAAQLLEGLLSSNSEFRLRSAAQTLLMRAAFRSGDFAAARRAARQSRKGVSLGTAATNGRAYLASAYVAAKFYSPTRAVGLLRLALRFAQGNHDLELEHLCRQGLGAVRRQLGQYDLSISEHELALALARRTLNQVLASQDATDLAVAHLSRGNATQSRALFEDALRMLEAQRDPYAPGLVLANQGEMLLTLGEIALAKNALVKALHLSSEVKDLPIEFQALAGLALCAQREGRFSDLRHWCQELRTLGGGREHIYHERWMVEAALAWDRALNDREPQEACKQLHEACRALRRVDLDHCLFLSLERLRLEKSCMNAVPIQECQALMETAESYGAGTVLSALQSLIQQR